MEPGRELDKLIAEKVMGWKRTKLSYQLHINFDTLTVHPGVKDHFLLEPPEFFETPEDGSDRKHTEPPTYSTNLVAAWEVVSKLAPIVGDFHEADGFFILKYADSADHTTGKNCPAEWTEDMTAYDANEDSEDTHKWSAHFHPGHPGADTESAKMFPDYKKSCARGRTAAHAICLAALKIFET